MANDNGNAELDQAVRDALMEYTPFRAWSHQIEIETRGSTVVLSGLARVPNIKNTVEKIVRAVKGVTSVENKIVADDEVEIAVAQALAADPRTRGGFPGIVVGVVFGIVFIKGVAASAAMKSAAAELAGKVPGVVRVSEELAVAA